jgi:predicted nuclease of predicted toxin-antitoxin system
MLNLAADENFNGRIIRGILRQHPEIDIIRLQDVGLSGAPDEEVLDYVASQGRVLLTHDAATIPRHAYERVVSEKPMPGVVLCSSEISIAGAIDDICLLALSSRDDEWEGQIIYLPL